MTSSPRTKAAARLAAHSEPWDDFKWQKGDVRILNNPQNITLDQTNLATWLLSCQYYISTNPFSPKILQSLNVSKDYLTNPFCSNFSTLCTAFSYFNKHRLPPPIFIYVQLILTLHILLLLLLLLHLQYKSPNSLFCLLLTPHILQLKYC